jgi:hypothetical protein
MTRDVGDAANAVKLGGTPQDAPFQFWPDGQAQVLPFQTWPPVQMLAQLAPFQEVPPAHGA